MDRGGLPPPTQNGATFFTFRLFPGKFGRNTGLFTPLHAQWVGDKSYGKFVRQLDTKYTYLKIYESKVERFTKCEKSAHDNFVSSVKSLCHYQLYRCRWEFHGCLVLKGVGVHTHPHSNIQIYSFFLCYKDEKAPDISH